MEITSDLVKILLPAALVLFGMYTAVQAFINRQLEEKKLEVTLKSQEQILPLRVQAFERLVLFLERITPNQLLLRVQPRAIQTADFVQLLLTDIREEYYHNIAQQIYVNDENWQQLTDAKDSIVRIIQQSSAELPADAPAIELSKRVMEKTLSRDEPITAAAIRSLKAEARELF